MKFSVRMMIIVLQWALSFPLLAADRYLTVYAGKYTDDRLGEVLLSRPITYEDSYLGVVALARAFPLTSSKHRWELEGQLGKHFQGQDNWEFNLLAIYRWQQFPWNHLLRTSVAVGDGLSYASDVPRIESASHSNTGATRLLNYILVEVEMAPPKVHDWSLVTRVHHRSGVYGVFGDVRGGSNLICAGVKIPF
ncbi:MAG: hypothetical protein HY272_00755 [Gammaproteobacteria bacterium]|nr:hypothetical protein [Gammaproteobacteria bacterium]